MSWFAVLVVCAACYAQKLLGMLVPATALERRPTVRRLADRLPAALLAALIATGALVHGHALVIDARLVGVAVAVALLLARAPLIAVVIGAAAATAGVRLL